MKKDRLKIIPSSYLVIMKDDKILLSRRYQTGFMDGYYGLAAGHMERAEGFTKAIIREVKEEINIAIKPEDIKVAHIMNRFAPQNDVELQERIDVFFLANQWHGEIKNLEPDKCDDLNWFPLDRLPINTIPYIKEAIKSIRKKIFYSEFGYKNNKYYEH
jgi:ADP-ribose pyrophosphatase YjhB (NUDIX family)